MTAKMRHLERLANDPRTPKHEAENARRILQRLIAEQRAQGKSTASNDTGHPPPSGDPYATVDFYAPGVGLIMIRADEVPEYMRRFPGGKALTPAEVAEWFQKTYGGSKGRSKGKGRSKSSSSSAGKGRSQKAPRATSGKVGKKRSPTKARDGKLKAAPKTRAEKELGFIEKVLRRSNAIQVAVATNDKVAGTWTAQGEAQIRAVLKKALAQAHLLAKRGYETCIAVIHEDGGQTVQCWPE